MPYSIKKETGRDITTAVICDADGETIAEYRLTPGEEESQLADINDAIQCHLSDGGTMGNYPW